MSECNLREKIDELRKRIADKQTFCNICDKESMAEITAYESMFDGLRVEEECKECCGLGIVIEAGLSENTNHSRPCYCEKGKLYRPLMMEEKQECITIFSIECISPEGRLLMYSDAKVVRIKC